VILSDREIRAALERGSIRLTPDPRADASLWSSTAVDLRLGEPLNTWVFPAAEAPRHFCPGGSSYDLPALIAQFLRPVAKTDDGFLIDPGRFYLGWTQERIQLPHRARLAARVEGKSSLARLGLGVHVTAPTIHAGFGATDLDPSFAGNPIQLEIWNTGPLPVVLRPGLSICQLIFEWVDGTPEQGYRGQFTIQGPPLLPPSPSTPAPAPRKQRRR
jgi:dCTP deaminase